MEPGAFPSVCSHPSPSGSRWHGPSDPDCTSNLWRQREDVRKEDGTDDGLAKPQEPAFRTAHRLLKAHSMWISPATCILGVRQWSTDCKHFSLKTQTHSFYLTLLDHMCLLKIQNCGETTLPTAYNSQTPFAFSNSSAKKDISVCYSYTLHK